MPITAAGTVPASILERNKPGDWVGTLDISGAAGITSILLTGQDASLFLASLGPGNRVTILPALSFDREAYAAGADPVLSFGLSLQSGGTWTALAQTWSVTLAGVDDTAPSGLRFSTGGAILETDLGGTIGNLVADDPDSNPANLTYEVLWPDSAVFEIVGTTLKLREGVDLLRLGGTVREVAIAASDGLNEAAFTLPVTVVNVTNLDGPVPASPTSPPYSPPVSPPIASPVSIPVSSPISPPISPPVSVSVATVVLPPPSPPATSPPPSPPVAAIVVTPTGSSTSVAEAGATDTFTLRLSHQPSAAVTLQLNADDDLLLASGTGVPKAKLVSFTIQPLDWATERVVTVGAVDDTLIEGPETARLTYAVTSADTAFRALTGTGLAVGVTDSDTNYGLTLRHTGLNTAVVEGGAGDTFTVALSARPTANVTLSIIGGADLLVSASGGKAAAMHSVVFTPNDWGSVRAVAVSGIEDGIVENSEVSGLLFRLSSTDPHYNNLQVAALPVMVADAATLRSPAATAGWSADLLRPAQAYDPTADKPPAAGPASDSPW